MIDEELYKIAMEELNTDDRLPDVWRRACALAGGDHDEARFLYTNLRVEEMLTEQDGITRTFSTAALRENPAVSSADKLDDIARSEIENDTPLSALANDVADEESLTAMADDISLSESAFEETGSTDVSVDSDSYDNTIDANSVEFEGIEAVTEFDSITDLSDNITSKTATDRTYTSVMNSDITEDMLELSPQDDHSDLASSTDNAAVSDNSAEAEAPQYIAPEAQRTAELAKDFERQADDIGHIDSNNELLHSSDDNLNQDGDSQASDLAHTQDMHDPIVQEDNSYQEVAEIDEPEDAYSELLSNLSKHSYDEPDAGDVPDVDASIANLATNNDVNTEEVDAFSHDATEAVDVLESNISDTVDSYSEQASETVGALANEPTDAIDALANEADDAIDSLSSDASDAVDSFSTDASESFSDNVSDAMSAELPSMDAEAMPDVSAESFSDAVSDMVSDEMPNLDSTEALNESYSAIESDTIADNFNADSNEQDSGAIGKIATASMGAVAAAGAAASAAGSQAKDDITEQVKTDYANKSDLNGDVEDTVIDIEVTDGKSFLVMSKDGVQKVIKQGASWPALLLTFPWLLSKTLFGTAFVYAGLWCVSISGLLFGSSLWMNAGPDTSLSIKVCTLCFALLAIVGLLYIPFRYGNDWVADKLQNKGFTLDAAVNADSKAAALDQLTSQNTVAA